MAKQEMAPLRILKQRQDLFKTYVVCAGVCLRELVPVLLCGALPNNVPNFTAPVRIDSSVSLHPKDH
jgi:hypothetical protein